MNLDVRHVLLVLAYAEEAYYQWAATCPKDPWLASTGCRKHARKAPIRRIMKIGEMAIRRSVRQKGGSYGKLATHFDREVETDGVPPFSSGRSFLR